MNTIRKHKKLTGLTTTVAYAALALSSFPGGLTAAPALPTGGHVVSGNAAIHQNGPNGLQIDQSSRAAIINWGDFSIGREGNVHFANGTGATLNRVTGGLPSRIDGSLTATGGVYLVNQAGVVVGKEGRIDTGGSFVASTHDVSDSAFLAGGDLVFSGSSDALVINAGQIGSLGGDVALIARRVENTGKLTAPQGAVALAAGYEVLARDAALSDGKFLVRIGGSDTAALNAGAIEAAAAELRANGGNVYALAGNTAGIIKATAVNQSGGRIIFDAGSTGAVELAGTIDASAQSGTGILPVSVASQSAPAPSGGLITATGQTITVKSGATLDASGATGGKILLGGDYQGGKNAASNFAPDGLTLATATTTTVEAGSLLRADGLAGDGGRIVVWADHLTSYAGHLSAQALGLTGDGGFTEVSGKNLLAYTGTADLRSARGVTGSLLLDPYNITIQASGTTAGSFDGSGNYTPTGSILRASDLEAALATSNVLVTTGGADSPGSQDGNIIVNAPLEWTSGNRLELSAYKNITIARDINAGSGSLILRSDNTGTGTGTVNFSSGTIITASGGVKIYFNPASNPVGSIVNPDSYKMETLVEQSAFWGHLNPDITTPLSAYMLVNTIYDLQNVSNNLNGFGDLSYNNNNRLLYALGRDIDATETITWNSGMGFLPIGSNNYLATTFDGQNHVISNLFSRYGGLFFSATGGYQAKILNLGLVDSYAEGNGALGALLNTSSGSATEPVVIDNVFASNATVVRTGINTSTPVGGLIGTFAGVLSNAWVSGSIASIRTQAGGLVGTLGAGSRVENAYSNVYFVLTAGQGETAGYHPIASSRPAGSVLLNTYWNTDRTAAADATGMTGLTSVQLADQANFAGFDFANTWAAPTTGAPFPTLKSFGSRDYHLDPAIIPVTYVIGGTAAYHYVYGDNPPAYVPPDLTLAFDGVDAADLASGLVRMVIYQQPVVGSQTDLATWYASFTANSQASDYNITALATLTSDSIAGYKKYVVNQKRSAELGTASIKMTVEKAPLIVVLRDIVKDVGETFAEGAVGTRYIEGTDLLSLFIENIEGLKNGQTPNRIQIVVAESGTENLRTVNLSKTGSNYSTSSLRVTTSTGGNANATTNYNMVVVPGSVRFGTAPVEKLVTYRFGLSGVSWVYGTDDRSLISWMLSGADEGDEVLGVLAIQNAGGDDVTAQSLLNAGTYKLTIGSLIGSEAGDYQINHVRSIPGTLTVQPVKLTYAFGQPTYTWSYSHDDRGQITWVLKDTNNQDFTDVAGSLVIKSGSTDVTAQSVIPGGAYALTINIADPNYQLTGTAGALTVSKIPLTITLANFVKSLDELTSFTEGTVGTKYVQGADLLSLFIEKVEGLADVDEITRLRIIVSESGTTNVRTVAPYTSSGNLQSTTLTITHDGGSLTFLNSYNVTILPGSITYTDVPVAKDVTYDFSGNAVTNWVYGTDNRGNITWRLDGVEGSDAVTGVLAIKQGETDVTAQALLNAGTYELHIGSLAGANAGDYRIAATGNTPGSLTVSKAPLTLKANDGLSKVYGDAFTFLGTEYAISAGQLYGTDAITGVTLDQ
ncbi:filamentous hemagglutinin family N-terminal domain protein, partial [Opitutaceae bacterium TAV1]